MGEGRVGACRWPMSSAMCADVVALSDWLSFITYMLVLLSSQTNNPLGPLPLFLETTRQLPCGHLWSVYYALKVRSTLKPALLWTVRTLSPWILVLRKL